MVDVPLHVQVFTQIRIALTLVALNLLKQRIKTKEEEEKFSKKRGV